ncbi:MAG: hypothetical protein NVSMB64_13860 [Candidatus Velthaea sp.]
MSETIDRLRDVVAKYLRCDATSIHDATPIDRRAVGSSILHYRMLAAIAKELGGEPLEPQHARCFGDLTGRPPSDVSRLPAATTPAPAGGAAGALCDIGIDIVALDELPRATDVREHEFYKTHFTPREIAQALLEPDPYASLAGRFAAKEALIKARCGSGSLRSLEILVDDSGRPSFADAAISISHSAGFAIAVAARVR